MARYVELAETLQERIAAGVYCDRLPSVLALSREFDVNPNTIQRTLELLKQRNYVYAVGGKGVFVMEAGTPRVRRVVTVFVKCFFESTNPFYMMFLKELHKNLAAKNVEMEIAMEFKLPDPKRCQAVLSLGKSLPDEEYEKITELIAPDKICYCDMYRTDKRAMICSDNFAGGRLAVDYLYAKGHRRIGILTYDAIPGQTFMKRLEGALSLAQEHSDAVLEPVDFGCAYHPDRIAVIDGALNTLFERLPDVTAIFVFNDQLASETVTGLRRRGLRAPEDISVIGYDNRSFAELLDPPLATIEEDYVELARLTALWTLAGRSRSGLPQVMLAPPHLIPRFSVRALNAEH